ncbi:MAG: DUF5069 domain-containing protein [Candidatus Latescibacterota bacterium]|nr:DUF5069 domain-containing protein [Candidatus Latescibacterota bacterium]
MDLIRQPPRRASNVNMAGIVGLARMTDKARGHNAELLGDYRYGAGSGLDVEVLEFINMNEEEFAEAADELSDADLGTLARECSGRAQADIDEFNREHLEREPQDDLHRQLLNERLDKFAPGRIDITTVFASMELDDWGCYKDLDLTQRPPRTPYLRSVFGIAGAARMADKARARTSGKYGDYKYGDDSYIDRTILEFLGISADDFAEAAYANPNDVELGEWITERKQPGPGEVAALNVRLTSHGESTPGFEDRFRSRHAEVCSDRPEVCTFYAMMDIDDQQSFGIVDLNRRPPRSPYDTSIGDVVALARMIDKGRAHLSGHLGSYWFGEDSGFDRRLLDYLGVTPDEFCAGLQENATDESVAAWLGAPLNKDPSALNRELLHLAPSNDRAKGFLRSLVNGADPSRHDIDTFTAMTYLDDIVTFARLWAPV